MVSEPLHPSFPHEFVESVLVSAIKSPPRTSTYSTGGGTSTKNHVPFSAEEVSGTKRFITVIYVQLLTKKILNNKEDVGMTYC